MLITSNIDERIVAEVLSYITKNGQTFDDVISDALSLYIHDRNSDEAILQLAIQKTLQLSPGSNFTVKQLMSDKWDDIESPKSFGREFKKRVLETRCASLNGKTSSNQAIYTACTPGGGMEAVQFSVALTNDMP